MTLKEAQEAVDKWISTYGVRYFNELTNMADELADVLFVLICLANQTGIDLEKSFQKNLQKKTARDFERHQQNDKLRNPRPQS
jgi:NTP pyrophosphatase (non-canonical NTP hydrolase)